MGAGIGRLDQRPSVDMVSDPLATWWVHSVTIEDFAGPGPEGHTFMPARTIACFVDSTRTLVRAPTGEQVVSEVTIIAPADTPPPPPASRVTLPASHGAHVTTVIAAGIADGGGLSTPDHVKIACA